MPTYSYRCADCGHQFDQAQKFTDDPLTVCPSCSGTIKRVIQPVGVVFKGSGWYITDSRKGESGSSTSKAPAAEKTADATSAPAEKAEKSEAKETTAAAPAAKESKVAAPA